MRRLVLLGLCAVLCGSCASDVTDVLGKPYDRSAVCFVPRPPSGMHRGRPTPADVNSVWQALDLRATEHIYYWFEDNVGNVQLGITDGTNDWEAELVTSGGTYTAKDSEWREVQLVCVG
jgi:hypothetical protein